MRKLIALYISDTLMTWDTPARHLLWLLLSISTAFSINACSKPEAEQQILAHIDTMQNALEEKKASDVLQFIAKDFQGSRQLNRQQIKRILLAQFIKHQRITVSLTPVVIKMDSANSERATMHTTAVVTGGSRLLPDDGRLYQINGEWRLVGGDWLLYSVEWQ